MPNGTDCSNVLQSEALCVPTQWFFLDCTADGRAGEWLKADLGNDIDYFHLALRDVDPETCVISMRPAVLHAILDAHARRVAEGSKGRLVIWIVGHLGDPAEVRLLAELPLDVSNFMFWESGLVPIVIRCAVGGTDEDRHRYLRPVREQYFGLTDFSAPYYGKHDAGRVYGNEFDSTLLASDGAQLRKLVEYLVPLHVEEARFARAHLQRHSPGGMFVIEDVMRNSARWRKIDWLGVAAYPFFKRLWDLARDDVLEVLDYRRCPGRAKDPWAALSGRAREKNWDDLGLDPTPWNPFDGERAYRITPGDHPVRLRLAKFLLRQDAFAEVLEHCEIARAEGGYDAAERWLKAEAMARHGLGRKAEARALFAQYRQQLERVTDPSAELLDEIGGIALMEGDFTTAYEVARRAIGKDRFLGHAYDTMVIAGRSSGNAEYERAATELAAMNKVTVPIHVRESVSQAMKGAKVIPAGAHRPTRRRWWQFWR
jgi:hypothetical protein